MPSSIKAMEARDNGNIIILDREPTRDEREAGNAKEQKLDIYGLKGRKKLWMMKKGKLVV